MHVEEHGVGLLPIVINCWLVASAGEDKANHGTPRSVRYRTARFLLVYSTPAVTRRCLQPHLWSKGVGTATLKADERWKKERMKKRSLL